MASKHAILLDSGCWILHSKEAIKLKAFAFKEEEEESLSFLYE